NMPDTNTCNSLTREKMQFAYGMILKKYCGYNSPTNTGWIHPYVDPHTGLNRYMELKIDARFIDVSPVGEMPKLPESVICSRTNRIMTIDELIEQVPLDKFLFEG